MNIRIGAEFVMDPGVEELYGSQGKNADVFIEVKVIANKCFLIITLFQPLPCVASKSY